MVMTREAWIVAKLVCQLHSACEESGEISESLPRSCSFYKKSNHDGDCMLTSGLLVCNCVCCYKGFSFKQMTWSPRSSFFFFFLQQEHS